MQKVFSKNFIADICYMNNDDKDRKQVFYIGLSCHLEETFYLCYHCLSLPIYSSLTVSEPLYLGYQP